MDRAKHGSHFALFQRMVRASLVLILASLSLSPGLASATPAACANIFQSTAQETPAPLWRGGNSDEFMKVRSNAPHFWSYAKVNGERALGEFIGPTGLVAGDPHILNLGDLWVKPDKPILTLIDIDDAGRAPLALDFARLVISAKASPYEIKFKEMSKAYLRGLKGKGYEPPEFVSHSLNISAEERLQNINKHTRKMMLEEKFNLEKTGLAPLSTAPADIRDFFTKNERGFLKALASAEARPLGDLQILDSGYKIKQTGGSQKMLRLWFLVRTNTERDPYRIYEFKALAEPATAHWEQQASQNGRIQDVLDLFWKQPSTQYQARQIDGVWFWLRPRWPHEIEIENKQQGSEWTLYCSYLMGRFHGEQSGGKKLLEIIEKMGEENGLEKLKDFAKSYLDLIEELP